MNQTILNSLFVLTLLSICNSVSIDSNSTNIESKMKDSSIKEVQIFSNNSSISTIKEKEENEKNATSTATVKKEENKEIQKDISNESSIIKEKKLDNKLEAIIQSSSFNSTKLESIDKTLTSIDKFKSKIENLSNLINKKLEIEGLPENTLQRAIDIHEILTSNKIYIISILLVIALILLIIILRASNKKLSNEFDSNDMIFIRDETYSENESQNQETVNSHYSSKAIGLKGRQMKDHKIDLNNYHYNINSEKIYSKYGPLNNSSINENKYSVNTQFKEVLSAKYNALYNNYNNNYNTNNTNNNYAFGSNKFEFSFGNEKRNFVSGKGLNDTVDYEEREEYADIINYLGN